MHAEQASKGALRRGRSPGDQPRIVYGVTVDATANSLLRGQLKWMTTQGWDVHLVCTRGDHFDGVLEREGVTGHPLEMSRGISPCRDMVALMRWIMILIKLRPDVVNVGTPKAGLLGSIAGALTGVKKRTYVVRGLRLESASGIQRRILWMMERLTIVSSTDVIAVSPSLRKRLETLHLACPSSVAVIGSGSSNGVDGSQLRTRACQVDGQTIRVAWGTNDDTFVIGYVGRLAKDKGISDLVEASKNLGFSQWKLVTVGNFEDRQLETELKSLGRRWIDHAWTDNVPSILRAFDVLVLPTYREGMPNVVLEAAALGVPAITTTATGACDSVVDEETGILIEPSAPRQLARAIDRLQSDPALRARLGTAAQARALTDFRPEPIWAALDQIYRGGRKSCNPLGKDLGDNDE